MMLRYYYATDALFSHDATFYITRQRAIFTLKRHAAMLRHTRYAEDIMLS